MLHPVKKKTGKKSSLSRKKTGGVGSKWSTSCKTAGPPHRGYRNFANRGLVAVLEVVDEVSHELVCGVIGVLRCGGYTGALMLCGVEELYGDIG